MLEQRAIHERLVGGGVMVPAEVDLRQTSDRAGEAGDAGDAVDEEQQALAEVPPGERVRIEPGRWSDGQADGKKAEPAEGRIVRLGGHSAVRLPNGTEEDLYVVELDHGGRTCVGTGWLVPLRTGDSKHHQRERATR